MANKKIKVAGYAQRIFFNDNIEYRNFSPDLVGLQLTSDGGTTLFTNGNFSISVNLDPKPDVLFKQGTKSKFFTLDDIANSATTQLDIQKNVRTKLNLDLTNPLSYIWYGSAKELIKSSLIEIQDKWPAAIYVDNKVGSITGYNITDYVYDIESDESTFSVNSNFFVNPYGIKYTIDSQYVGNNDTSNPLRNFTIKYSSYVIEHNGISKKIKTITPATQKTNSVVELVVEGNPFPELTGIFIPQLSFLFNNVNASIPYFIKPNEDEIEKFFSGLNDFQLNILNRNIYPKYKSEIISTNFTDDGVLLTSKSVLNFPVLEDGYNLNFFDSFYIAYIDSLNKLGEGLDETKTDTIIRKYTTEAISSFDTLPKADGNDYVINGEKATKLLRIYGVEFDYIKKYINAIKFAHIVTYDKKNNVPDSLVKDLAFMLGLEPINFITDASFGKLFLPSNGSTTFSGSSVNMTQAEIDIELYRRLILNIAWLWKSKGSRKAVEFLFRFIGAPESLVNFNEYIVILDKPLDMEEIKKLLYLYTGQVNLQNIPYDENGFPLPPLNGDIVISNFIDSQTGGLVENDFTEMYFQKAGGWYRETYGSNVVSVLNGNNPHVGPYDGGNEYLQYFSRCFIPNFENEPTVTLTANTLVQNYFLNYNYGIFNGINDNSDIFTTQLTYNSLTNGYQPIEECLDVEYSIIETPLQNDGKTTIQQAFDEAESQYNAYLELIKKDNYLIYSPEWQVIKNNYEFSLKNCLNEVATENCDINKTLQICLSEKEKDLVEYSCSNLNLEECSPFVYYTNDDGLKVSFDEFPSCCKSLGGNYVSYVNEYGRQTEYCSKLAPCIGTPDSFLPNGIVVFTMTNNTIPQEGMYQINGKCYQYINTQISLTEFEQKNGSPEKYISNFCGPIKKGKTNFQNGIISEVPVLSECSKFFGEVSCVKTSIVSSPECCAWHGFDYQIVTQNSSNQATPSTSLTNAKTASNTSLQSNQVSSYVVCLKTNQNTVTELTAPNSNYTLPYIDFSVNNSYYNLQNPIGSVYNYYATEIFWDCFNEARIVKGLAEGTTSIAPQPNSILQDPELMNPANWEVESIDEYGRISFTPKIFNNNFILDWNSSEELGDLYKNIADYYGYQFGQFTIDYVNNILIPFTGDNPYTTNPNNIITAAVDPTKLSCNVVNNVSVVFASEKWSGFKLPELDDCSCTIDFSFDYMLKYEAQNLINCADEITCHPAIIYDATKTNINCLNFVAFTNTDEESQNLQINFNDSLDPIEEYVIWQNTNILEPNNECCVGIGGNVVSVNQWASTNQVWVNTIIQNYNTLSNNPSSEFLNSLNFNYSELLTFIKAYGEIKNELISLLDNCYTINFSVDPCEINYGEYITTQSICSLQLPLECGLWSKVNSDYQKLQSEIDRVINLYNNNCSNEPVGGGTSTNTPIGNDPILLVELDKELNGIVSQKDAQLKVYNSQETALKTKLIQTTDTISQKESDIVILQKSLTNVNTSLDCSVYENKIKELKSFDYFNYCTVIVYGNQKNDGSKNEEYNNCISSKTIENEEQIVIYSQLFSDCVSVNQLNDQLVSAKFENNLVLITELEKQIQDLTTNINTLTTNANSYLSYDESLQKSAFLSNDTKNTISRTAEILGVSEKSITDNSGNIVLSDRQKVTLNIELTKNQNQINTLNTEKSEIETLLRQNVSDQQVIEKDSSQQQSSYRMVAAAPGGDKGGGGSPVVYGCTLTVGTYDYDYANGYKYLINPASGPTPAGAVMDPSYYSDVWTLVPGTNPQLYKKGTCYGVRSLITTGGGNTSGTGILTNPAGPVGTGGGTAEIAVGPKEPVTNCKTLYPVNTLQSTPNGVILSNGKSISVECCNKDTLGFEVFFDPNQKQCVQFLPLSCKDKYPSNSLSITPNGVILSNGKPIPEECCTKDVTGVESVYDPTQKECTLIRVNNRCCDVSIIDGLEKYLKEVNEIVLKIEFYLEQCYNNWYDTLLTNYKLYEETNNNNYLNYIDDLKLNFKLFVDNNNITTQNSVDTNLTYLPYTQSVNPIWEFDPTQGYSGIIIDGDEQLLAQIEDSIFNQLSSQNISYNSNLFEPDWKTFNFTIPECVCDDLRRLYPNKEFFFSIEIENYECNVCLLVDNIMVNVSDCKTNRILSINDCMIPQLSCVIDNKKSWVYYEGGIKKETVYPDGECNTASTNNYEIVKFRSPEDRLWTELEYRYTNYDVYHSDLILNVKNTTFSIDPAKSIECDVFNFWKKIDCDNCPTNCETDNKIFQSGEDMLFQQAEEYIFQDQISTYINFNGVLNINNILTNYTIDLGASTSSVIPFSCETFTNILQNQVIELKNEYYTLTANYSESLNANYYDLLNKGESLSKFYIDRDSCNTDILVLNNNKNLDNLFSLIVEDSDGTINLFEIYVYSGTPLYTGGVEQQIGAGITAQTFNQSSEITKECCLSINKLLNDNGVDGLGLGKNYRWDELNEVCYWRDIDECANCKGDCEYCGKMKECVSGVTTNNTYSVCINPLDYFDTDPTTIMVKDVFDQMVLRNLIDVKSRQTISDYPLLRLFYELYLNASNCGKDLSGKFTYDTMFEFMDKIGDYWLDLIEQVVPATTIWEGCDNSGKIYRNTIFDQNKFKYKKYSLNFIDVENDCPLSVQTNFSIGEETIYSLVEQKPIYPTSDEINNIKNQIRNKEIEIAIANQQLNLLNSKLCSLNLQDTNTPNLGVNISEINLEITEKTNLITQLNNQLSDLLSNLEQLETEYIEQQNNYLNNFMSCSGITQSLIQAQNNLSNFTPGTTSYERQRNFIAGLRNKYDKCVRKANTLISDYNTVFITQIYDSNEYEGNVTILGDPDWEEGGPFYNQELIHNC